MIQANELRIGNYVRGNLGGILKIKGIKEESDLSHIRPIPLTPEILEKCGFKKWGRDDMPRTLSYELGSMQIFPSNTFCDFDGYGFLHYKLPNPIDGKDESARFKFNHLHQLQNLYYALTGEELTYNQTIK
jgi:hypothetical protein